MLDHKVLCDIIYVEIMGEYMDIFLGIMFIVFILVFVVLFFMLPIMVANSRGISGGQKTTIVILSCFGVFFLVTWFVALVLALVYAPDTKKCDLDKLEQIARLYKERVITKQEYEKMKSELLKQI